MDSNKGIKFVCDICGCLIEIGRPRYVMKGELYCAYDGAGFDETSESEVKDPKAEMARLIELAEQKTEKELSDEIHFAFDLDLCSECRLKIYEQLERAEYGE